MLTRLLHSCSHQGRPQGGDVIKKQYAAKQLLEELDSILSERDKAILRSLLQCRYLLTGQIRRLHFTDSANPAAGLRATNAATAKLKNYGLIEPLERRIGGVRAGSHSYVWTLTESGFRLLNLNDGEVIKRKRSFEPSVSFLNHTLGVSETFVRIKEMCEGYQLELIQLELEPACWRNYAKNGKLMSLNPDLFAVTQNDRFQDSWFIEVDCGTESLNKIMEKCRRYVRYRNTGIEQKKHEVFPLVVYLVANENRKNALCRYIADCREIPEPSKNIFIVILQNELETLIYGGVTALTEKERSAA